jgi:hypothetical protein
MTKLKALLTFCHRTQNASISQGGVAMNKKVSIIVLALLFVISFTSFSFAQGGSASDPSDVFKQKMNSAKIMHFSGTVLSHDVACHCMVVKTAKGNVTVQDDYIKFDQNYNKAKGLQIGAKVKGTYKTVDYINYGADLELE